MSDPTKRTVLVLGAAGRFGQAAVTAFAEAGWTVIAQARQPLPQTAADVRYVSTPLADTTALADQARRAALVVHAINPPYPRWRPELLPLARQAMDLAERLGARFMLPGNVYAYGQGMPARLDEHTPERPTTAKGRLRAELEAAMRDRARAGRLRGVVIRAGDFFGCGRGSWLDLAVVRSLHRGRLVYPGPTDVPHAWAYLPDLARACVAVAEADDGRTPWQQLHFAGHTLTGTQLLDAAEAAARAIGVELPPVVRRAGMPWTLMRIGGLVVPMWRSVAEMAYLWQVPHALDDTALRAIVGPLPTTPIDRALRESLRALGLGAADGAAASGIVPATARPGALRGG